MEQDTLAHYWMPFTSNRSFKTKPKLFSHAEGMYYYTPEGEKVLDGTAGLWCVNAGHGRKPIVEAIQKQAQALDYAPSFQLGHPLAFEFAERLCDLAPQGFSRAFFTNSGSESADTALKIALAYQQARGEASRTHLVGRERGYHGVGFGGLSVGGIPNNRKYFSLLPNVHHLPHTHDLAQQAFSQGQPEWGAHLADELKSLLEQHGEQSIAAVMVEPMAGSTGVLLPPKGYLQALRKHCDDHGILLIFDEVITAFGRLGAPFGSDYFGVIPDIITTAKGLTSGYVPMGAVLVKQAIYDTIVNSQVAGSIEFFHGYTYSGHPLACAAGLACLDLYANEELFTRATLLADHWQQSAHALRDCAHVIDIRNLGLVAAIELESRPGAIGQRAMECFSRCFDKGLLIRVTADTIALSPPLIIEKAEVDQLFTLLRDALNETH